MHNCKRGNFPSPAKAQAFGEKEEAGITEYLAQCGILQACVILGGCGVRLEDLPEEFHKMEEMLRFHFLWMEIKSFMLGKAWENPEKQN